MTELTNRNRVLYLFAVLAVMVVVTTGLLNTMAAHAWLPDAPETDVGGTINSDTTWTLAGSPYVLTNELTLATGVTLTIEPGVVVMGSIYSRLLVEGHLEAVGTATEPILFTSSANTGPGEWSGLLFIGGTGHLNYADVRYTAGSGIIIDGVPDDEPVIIENSTIQDNLGYPLTIATGNLHRLQLNNVSASGNGANRTRVFAMDRNDNALTRDTQLTAVPGMDGYEFTQNGLIVPTGITLTLDPGVMMMGDKSVLSVAGHLEAVGTLTDPITFTSAVDTAPGQWEGIYFDGGTGHLNHTRLRYAGQLEDAGILIGPLFDNIADGPVTIENSIIYDNLTYPIKVGPGSLHQLHLDQVSFANNGLNHIAIMGVEPLAGDVTLADHPGLEAYELVDPASKLIVPAGITLTLKPGVTLLMPDTFALVEVYGHLEAVGTAVSPITLTAKTGQGMSERVPVSIEGSAHLDHVFTGGNLNIGVWGAEGGPVFIENSTLSGSTFYPLFVGNNALHRLQMSNVTFTGNIRNRVAIETLVDNGAMSSSARLTAQPGLEGYQINHVLPESVPNLIVPNGITLTLEPGVVFMGSGIDSVIVGGHLEAEGTAVSPVTFTSITDTLPGEWGGLVISGTARLDHAIIRNGQRNLAVRAAAGAVSITHSTISQASDIGLEIEGEQLTAVCTTFTNNIGDAIYVAGSPDVTVFSSSISGNGSGVNNVGSTAVDARQNWWGDASGPGGIGSGSGDAVWGNVLYDPWLNEPTCTLTPYHLFLPVVIGP